MSSVYEGQKYEEYLKNYIEKLKRENFEKVILIDCYCSMLGKINTLSETFSKVYFLKEKTKEEKILEILKEIEASSEKMFFIMTHCDYSGPYYRIIENAGFEDFEFEKK